MAIIDSVVNSVIDAFRGGPSNWRDRLQGQITFISPEGNEFTGLWRGSPRTMPKKLGVLRFPKIKGDIVQDLDVQSTLYSITFFFEGENNDTEAAAFFQACKERGTWEVTHPVHGFLGLQLVSVTELDNPIESGNITEINSEWIEPIDPLELKTARELAGIIDAKADDLNISAAQQFANNILTASEELRGAIEQTTDGIGRVVDLFLGPLFTTVDAIDNVVNGIQQGITDTNQATVFQAQSLAGQVQNLINLPLFANNKLENRLTAYGQVVTGLSAQLPGGDESLIAPTAADDTKINSLATLDLALSAVIASLGNIVTTTAVSPRGLGADDTGALQTKAQAIKAVIDIIDIFNAMTDNLETAADLFSDNDIDDQYYSQSESYTDAATLVYLSVEYLLSIAFNLSVERRFIIDKPRAPIEITITEYGELGENDSFLDLFVRSNNLIGKDIMLLPRGFEVVIYA
jgi:prophage DNA circulation protein